MKRSFAISVLLLFSGIVLGGGGMYLVHIAMSSYGTVESAQEDDKANDRENLSERDSQSYHEIGSLIPDDYHSISSLEEPIVASHPFQRKFAIYSYVARLSQQDLTSDINLNLNDSNRLSAHVFHELKTALVERLAKVEPETALSIAVAQKALDSDVITSWFPLPTTSTETEFVFMPVVQSVFYDWAVNSLESAVHRAKSLDSDTKRNALTGILSALAGLSLQEHRQVAKELGDEERGTYSYLQSLTTDDLDDPQGTWDEVIMLIEPSNYNYSQVLLNIARQWYVQDGLGVVDEISTSSLDQELKTLLTQHLLLLETEQNPAEAFQYAQTIPHAGMFPVVLNSVALAWSESDPQSAFQAVSNIDNSGQRQQLQINVVRSWAENEPRYVLENLESFSPILQGWARSSSIGAIASTSPQEAAELALEHGSAEPIAGLLPHEVMREWVKQDVEAAIDWVYNGPLNEENQYTWMGSLTTYLVSSDPHRAFDLALKQKIPRDGGELGLEAGVILELTNQNLELAAQLLPQVRAGKTRTSAYKSVGAGYINSGFSKKAFNLGLELPDSDQSEYYQSISSSWARVDPESLVESLKDFPTDEIRSTVASSLSSSWMRGNFTVDQLEVLKQYTD